VLAGLGLEVRLFAPNRDPGRREAIGWATGWLLVAVAVAIGIALAGGPSGEWSTVYLISLDAASFDEADAVQERGDRLDVVDDEPYVVDARGYHRRKVHVSR